MLEADPDWRPFVAHWLQAGLGAPEVAYMLSLAQIYARQTARGFSLKTKSHYRPYIY